MRTNCGKILIAGLALASAEAIAALPVVTSCEMSQPGGVGDVTIKYKFTGADAAVITLDVQTNAVGGVWSSIGGEAICNAQGEVWKKVSKVSDETEHVITWKPSRTWKDSEGNGFTIPAGGARAVVTAWATNNTPNYMVVSLTNDGTENTAAARCRFYPAVDFLPGSEPGQKGTVTNNPAYKTSMLVMRKIMAEDVTWSMGSTTETGRNSSTETAHVVQIEDVRTNAETGLEFPCKVSGNYYIGIFEITHAQYALFTAEKATKFTAANAMRPVEGVCYNEIRLEYQATSKHNENYWPNAPYESSFLGYLRTRFGGEIAFDLPSEAQWEFAARAGQGEGFWGDGSPILDATSDSNLNRLGRYKGNWESGEYAAVADVPSDILPYAGGTAIVGSYAPNKWGLYDMHGNVREWCLDWYWAAITAYGGKVNVDENSPGNRLSVGWKSNSSRVAKGGSWWDDASSCRAAYRYDDSDQTQQSQRKAYIGFRVVCPVGIP